MGSKHVASGSTSSAIAGPSSSSSSHVKRRSGGQHSSVPPSTTSSRGFSSLSNGGDGGNSSSSNSNLFGLGLEHEKALPRTRRSSPSRNASLSSRHTHQADEDWSSLLLSNNAAAAMQEAERGSSSFEQERIAGQPLSSSTKNTPTSKLRRSTSSTTRRDHNTSTAPWMNNWTSPDRRPLSTTYSEDALMMDADLHSPQSHTSPYRSHQAGIPSLYRSSPSASSSTSSFYRSDSTHMIASTSQSSLYETSTLSPSASFTTLSPSKSPSFAVDPRRNLETTLSIAPSPPMPSSSFQPHHLSTPNSLTNRTSPKSGPHARGDSLSTSTCMPVSSSTSSFFASARRVNSTDSARDVSSDHSRTVPGFKHDQNRQARWRNTFNWKSRKRSPSDEVDSVASGVRQPIREASRLCMAVASACLGPFFPLVFPEQAISSQRLLSKSSSGQNRHLQASPHRRWQSRAFRFLLGLYVFYSLFLFTSRLLNFDFLIPPSDSTNSLKHQKHHELSPRSHETSDYTKWQQARFKLLDVYNVAADAIGSTALRIGSRQSSKAAAGDFAGESNGATSLNNLMLLDRLPEVKRRWGDVCKSDLDSGSGESKLTVLSTKYSPHSQSCFKSTHFLLDRLSFLQDVLKNRRIYL